MNKKYIEATAFGYLHFFPPILTYPIEFGVLLFTFLFKHQVNYFRFKSGKCTILVYIVKISLERRKKLAGAEHFLLKTHFQ